jgi:hypothetical protein
MIPRGSNASKTKSKQDAFKIILDYANRPGMESFTAADIAPHLPAKNMAAIYLTELVDSNMIGRRGAATDSYHYSKKPTQLLRRAWR